MPISALLNTYDNCMLKCSVNALHSASFVHKFSPWLRKHLSRKCNFPSFSPTSLWHLHCWTRLDRNWEQKHNFPFQFLMPQTPWRWVGQGHWKCKSWMKVTTMRSQEDSASCSLQEKPQNCLHKSQRYGWPYSSLLRLTSIFTRVKNKIFLTCYQRVIFWHTHTQNTQHNWLTHQIHLLQPWTGYTISYILLQEKIHDTSSEYINLWVISGDGLASI